MRLYTLVILAAILALAPDQAPAAQEAESGAAKPQAGTIILQGGRKTPLMLESKAQDKEQRLAKANHNMLHRLDLRVEGSGCAACLGRVRKRIAKLSGVIEVAVAIQKPYGVAVIYDASKISQEQILNGGKKGESVEIKFLDIEDVKIDYDKLPLILVPKINNLLKKD